MEPPAGRVKAETRGNHPLPDVISEQLELRTGSGPTAKNPIDVGVRGGASTGLDLEKASKNAGDVTVRYASVAAGLDSVRSPISILSRPLYCGNADTDVASLVHVLSRLFLHILSSVMRDWASLPSWVTGFRIISLTSHRFGPSASSTEPSGIVSRQAAGKDPS